MFTIIFFLILNFIKSQESGLKELPLKGKVTVHNKEFIYLKIDNFDKGNNIYLNVSFKINKKLKRNELIMYYKEIEKVNISDIIEDFFEYKSESFYIDGDDHIFYYAIKKENESNFLVIRTPDLTTYNISDPEGYNNDTIFTIENIENNNEITVILFGVIVIILFVASFLVYEYILKKQKENTNQQPNSTNQNTYVPPTSGLET